MNIPISKLVPAIIIILLALSGCESYILDNPAAPGAAAAEDLVETIEQTITPLIPVTPSSSTATSPPASTAEQETALTHTQEVEPTTFSEPVNTPKPPFVKTVIDSLTSDFNLTEESIHVRSIEPVDWPDTSLGCALPGLDYAQVITPGYIITVEARDITYIFHTDAGERAILCTEDGMPLLPGFPISTDEGLMDGIPWVPVD